jgi:Fe-S cluster assembly iron-binding protein IscA
MDWRLALTLDELKNDEDVLVEMDGIKIVYDKAIEAYVKNSTVDYSDRWYEKGFILRGPGVGSC